MSRFRFIARAFPSGVSCARDSEGASAVQFALILPLLLLIIFTVYEFGRLYWIQNTLQYATEQTARCIMANPTVTSVTGGTCALSNNLPGLTVSSPTAQKASCAGALGGLTPVPQCMTVSASYSLPSTDPLNAIMSAFVHMVSRRAQSAWSFTLTGTSTVPIT
jgi:Flp pilus assembly protein TadG